MKWSLNILPPKRSHKKNPINPRNNQTHSVDLSSVKFFNVAAAAALYGFMILNGRSFYYWKLLIMWLPYTLHTTQPFYPRKMKLLKLCFIMFKCGTELTCVEILDVDGTFLFLLVVQIFENAF